MRGRLLSATFSALLLGAAFPPVGLTPLAWISLVPLFWALGSKGRSEEVEGGWFNRVKRPFALGYLFGFVFFLATVYWVVYSMYVYGEVSFGLALFFMFLLVAVLALYPALFAVAWVLSARRPVFMRLFLIPSAWVGLEYLRTILFTGFPWELIGYSQARFTPLIQIADIFGVYGLSFLLVLVNFAIYACFFADLRFPRTGELNASLGQKIAVALAALVLLTSTLAYGFIKIRSIDARLKDFEVVKVAVAQGNIDQALKWSPEYRLKTVDIYRELSLKAAGENPELIIWPESAMPTYLLRDSETLSLVSSIAIDTRAYLLTGSPHYEDNEPGSKEWESYFNSAFLFNPEGMPVGSYKKVKLVPFGEYVPLKRALFFIKKLTEGYADFSPGPGHLPIRMGTRSLGVLICFESIFPGISSATVRAGASVLIVLTNDGWFGRTSAAYQHFDMAILRAVENRITLVRAANRGISGVVDPLGRVVKETGLLTREVFTADITLREKGETKTFFTLYGKGFPIALIGFFLVSLFKTNKFKINNRR